MTFQDHSAYGPFIDSKSYSYKEAIPLKEVKNCAACNSILNADSKNCPECGAFQIGMNQIL
jgi:rRNA maturation endonuclease Nob1